MHFGVIGSGFGIYGWLVALSHFKDIKISTLQKYKYKIYNRNDFPDFANFEKFITWHKNEQSIFNEVDTLIVARRPSDQFDLICHLIRSFF